jgi:hypothetical protein
MSPLAALLLVDHLGHKLDEIAVARLLVCGIK